jgi:hypothetical protein
MGHARRKSMLIFVRCFSVAAALLLQGAAAVFEREF